MSAILLNRLHYSLLLLTPNKRFSTVWGNKHVVEELNHNCCFLERPKLYTSELFLIKLKIYKESMYSHIIITIKLKTVLTSFEE